MSGCVVSDVLHRSVPWWIASFIIPEVRANDALLLLLTQAQRRQYSALLLREMAGAVDCKSTVAGGFSLCLNPALEAQAVIAHSRLLRAVHPDRGDVALHVDTAAFLSCGGRTLTTVAGEVALLEEHTRRDGLTSPFWLTEAQVSAVCAYGSLQRRFGGWSSVVGAASPNAAGLELSCGTPEVKRYINWGTVCTSSRTVATLTHSLSLFRCFTPINVRTKTPFCTSVELRLRVEAVSSDCWCSIWGTTEDYAACGFATLDGALGVDVFDDLGNPLFLICALCTTTPLDVYASCYPNDCIC